MKRMLALSLLLALSTAVFGQDDWPVDDFVATTGVREGPVASRDLPGWSARPTILISPRWGFAELLQVTFPELDVIVVNNPAEAMAEAILQILSNHEKAKQMGIAAQTRIAENFTVEHQVIEVQKIYDSILDNFRRRKGK